MISERIADELSQLRSQLKGNMKADQSLGVIEKYSRQLASNGLSSINESMLSETQIEEKIRKKLEKEF
jgi:hypothetical protein